MPCPRFTKVIIHNFMSQHKSISKRQGLPYHNDGVLDRLKFISKGEEHLVYGKLIPDILVTDDMEKYDTYKTFIVLSTGSIPPKKERGKGTQGTKATIIPKKETFASKKKRPKKIESSDEESEEQEESLIRRKPRGFIIQDTSQVSKKKSTDHEGVGITLEVPDELTGKSTVSDEGAHTSLEVLDERKDKIKAQDDLDDCGLTDDETFLFDDKDEKVEYILWVSNNEDESDDDDDEEDDKIIDIKMIDDEKTDTDVED
ncbi:hypothetical protein Tco_0043802 [Tanacetum coccineum]